jgi:hypothetical protein
MQMDVDKMKKLICKECGHTMTQHGKFKYIYYCNNILCKFYAALMTRKG